MASADSRFTALELDAPRDDSVALRVGEVHHDEYRDTGMERGGRGRWVWGAGGGVRTPSPPAASTLPPPPHPPGLAGRRTGDPPMCDACKAA
jgi:hypothetical protein